MTLGLAAGVRSDRNGAARPAICWDTHEFDGHTDEFSGFQRWELLSGTPGRQHIRRTGYHRGRGSLHDPGAIGAHGHLGLTAHLRDRRGIDPDPSTLNFHGKEPQWPARPARRDATVVEIERRQMAGAKQPAIADATKAQICLFMRAGPFAGDDASAVPNKQNVDGTGNAYTGNRLLGKTRERQNIDPPRLLPHQEKLAAL